jgi:hypothetical protein
MATAQAIVNPSKYDDNIDDYFTRPIEDDFQQQTFIYPDQQKSKTTLTKSKPRKTKRSGRDFY